MREKFNVRHQLLGLTKSDFKNNENFLIKNTREIGLQTYPPPPQKKKKKARADTLKTFE